MPNLSLNPSLLHNVSWRKRTGREILSNARGSAHAPVNGGPVFPRTILGYFGLIKHFLAEFLLFSTLYILFLLCRLPISK